MNETKSKSDLAAQNLRRALERVAHTASQNDDALHAAILTTNDGEVVDALTEILAAIAEWKQAGQDWFDAYRAEEAEIRAAVIASRQAAVTAVDLGGAR